LWAAHFCGALLLPRMVGGAAAAAALEAAASRGPAAPLTAWLAWPAVALCDNAGATGPWLAQALAALYLLVGPWGVVAPFGHAPGGRGRLALYGPTGFNWLGGGGGGGGGGGPASFLASHTYVPDAARVGALHLIGAVAPSTAWLAAAASAWARAARRGGADATPSLASSAGVAAGGLAALATSAGFAFRFAWQLGGWPGVLASPGLTWMWPFAAALVVGGEVAGRRKGRAGRRPPQAKKLE